MKELTGSSQTVLMPSHHEHIKQVPISWQYLLQGTTSQWGPGHLLQATTATLGMEKSSGTCRTAPYVTANSLPFEIQLC